MLTELEAQLAKHLLAESDSNGHDFGVWYGHTSARGAGLSIDQCKGLISSLIQKKFITDWSELDPQRDGCSSRCKAQYTLSEDAIEVWRKAKRASSIYSIDEGRPVDLPASLAEFFRKSSKWDPKVFNECIVEDV